MVIKKVAAASVAALAVVSAMAITAFAKEYSEDSEYATEYHQEILYLNSGVQTRTGAYPASGYTNAEVIVESGIPYGVEITMACYEGYHIASYGIRAVQANENKPLYIAYMDPEDIEGKDVCLGAEYTAGSPTTPTSTTLRLKWRP